jgi:hypothetical protein
VPPIDASKITVRRNCAADLVDCRMPGDERPTRPMLADALARIQQGQHLFTCIEGGRLLGTAWLAAKVTKELREQLSIFPSLSNCMLAHDFSIASSAESPGAAELLLRAMVQHAAGPAGNQPVVVAVPAHTALADSCASTDGLKYLATIFESRTMGRRRYWSDTKAGAAQDQAAASGGN